MNRKFYSVVLVTFLSTGTWSFAQTNGQGRVPASGPAVGAQIGQGGGNQGPNNHGQANKPAEPNKSANSGKNDVATRLRQNPDLASKLQGMLPAGMNVETAASNFKSVGQFVAAVHVSKNLDIPFDQLKGAMVTNHMSLGDAIHGLKPEITSETAKLEAQKAEEQAKEETKKIS
jgi:hypothetical protein